MKTYGMVAALLCLTSAAGAEVRSKVVDYKQGDTPLQRLLAWDDTAKGKRPGILVVHEWWGNNKHARNQALRLAKAGYVAFALDMYGQGKVTRILVMTGEADPMVTADQVQAFRKEMTDAGAKLEIISYPGAKHGFTNPDAGKAGMDALAYNADADKKSWAAMLATFKQVFTP